MRDTRNNTTHTAFECELALKPHAKDVEVGTSANGNIRQDQVTMWRVHSLGSNNNQSLSLVRIQYNAPVIAPLMNLRQVTVKGGSNGRSVC